MTDVSTLRLGGQELPITSLSMTMENNCQPMPSPGPWIAPGQLEVSGELAVTFAAPVGWYRPGRIFVPARFLDSFMRATMSRRAYRRWRGKHRGKEMGFRVVSVSTSTITLGESE